MPRGWAPVNVFVSYRRNDSVVHARLLAGELARRWGDEAVFMDIEDIPYGGDFLRAIDEHLAACEAVVAVIGPRWTETLRERAGGDDYVRHELAQAYALGRRVVPVLVGGAAPPPAEALPKALAPLATANMLVLDERYLLAHVNALLEALQGESFEKVASRLQQRVRSAHRMQFAGAAAALVMFFAAWTALFEYFGLDTRAATLTMRLGGLGGGAPAWSGQVVVAGIDEASERRLGRSFDAGWRREHAQLVDRAVRAGARAVAFDLFFVEPRDDGVDAAFEAALREARQAGVAVVLGVEALHGDGMPELLPRFAAVAPWGIACAGERFGAARSMVAAVAHGGGGDADRQAAQPSPPPLLLPSLALAAFSGGGAVEAIDGSRREVRVRLPARSVSADVGYSIGESLHGEQPDCAALARGDRVASQLLDPAALPELAAPPRRWSYGELLAADDAALRSALQGRILLVGLQLANRDEKTVAGGGRRGQQPALRRRADRRPARRHAARAGDPAARRGRRFPDPARRRPGRRGGPPHRGRLDIALAALAAAGRRGARLRRAGCRALPLAAAAARSSLCAGGGRARLVGDARARDRLALARTRPQEARIMTTMNLRVVSRSLRAAVAWLVAVSLALSGCAAPPSSPGSSSPGPGAYATLAAVVVDTQRLARGDEWASQVRVWRGNAPLAVQPRMALQPGDLVQTGPGAHAVLYFQNAEVLMRPSSQGRIGSLTDMIGEVFVKIRGAFSVETRFVRAGARGTAYLVRGLNDGAAEVTVFDGTVTLSSRVGAWAPYELPTGATAYCPPRAGAVQARQATPGELEQTRSWVEKIEKLVAPRTNYGKVAAVAGIAVLLGIILSNQGRGGGDRPSSEGSGVGRGRGAGNRDGGTGTTGAGTQATPSSSGSIGADRPVPIYRGPAVRRPPAPAPSTNDQLR